MNFKILTPEETGHKYWVVPAYGSGQCWDAETEEEARQILRFIRNRTPELITNVRKIEYE
jgi:hypothetical protein